jgi:peptidoglycan/xylan/chitin deacetylase (PgdA/CDA1 family)
MQQAIPILMYHSIATSATARFASCVLAPAAFAEQMAFLDEHGYTPITVSRLVESLGEAARPLPERPVVLTFDDGYADFYTNAFPVLSRHGFTATFYVVTKFVNGTSSWLRYEGETDRPMVTWSQLRELNAAGIECGAHTRTHAQIDTLSRSEAWDEVNGSRDELEQQLGCAVTSFAYPFGHYDTTTRSMLGGAGFTSSCAVKIAMSSLRDDRFALSRVMPMPDMDLSAYARLLDGAGQRVAPFAPRWQRRARDTVRRGVVRLERRLGLEALQIEYRTRIHPG